MKLVISVPDGLFVAGEQLARQLGISPSQLYSDALASYLSARSAEEVTARLNALYSAQPSEIEPAIQRAEYTNLANEAW